MPPTKKPPRSGGKTKSSPSRAREVAGGVKKLGSLSSFQPALNFSRLSTSRSTFAPTRTPSLPGTGSDSSKMPPPPPGLQTETSARAALTPSTSLGSSTSATVGSSSGLMASSGQTPVNGRSRKGKEREVIEVLDNEEVDEPRPLMASNHELWADLYAPKTEADLAPGKNRILRVKSWLCEALFGHPEGYTPPRGGVSQASRDKLRKYKRILLLTGPAGVGKTTTLRVLAKQMGVDIIEWGEAVEESSFGRGFDRESPITKMTSFLLRHSYAPLKLSTSTAYASASSSAKPRLLLLTSLPNLSHQQTREAFHAALLTFCRTFTSSSCPLVIVHSDAGSGGKAEESWLDRDNGGREGALELLGREVKEGPWYTEIDFIPLAPTFLVKALNRITTLVESRSVIPQPKHSVQLIALSCNGDLRSAINSLQLLCTRNMQSTNDRAKSRRRREEDESAIKEKRVRMSKKAKLDVSEELRAVLEAVTRREQSLNLFHALGKVFYNKRDPNQDEEDQELLRHVRDLQPDDPLPKHMSDFARRKSLVQMETFIPTIPLDASSFALWIHQSLPSFCSKIEEVADAVDHLCRADIMRTDDDIWQSSQQAISYALYLTVRGAHIALPTPVPRNHQKILKPEFYEKYRTERNNLELFDNAARYLAKKAVSSSLAHSEVGLGGEEGEDGRHAPWGGVVSKSVLASEVVPMLIKLQGMSKRPLLPISAAPLRLPPYATVQKTAQELSAADAEVEDGDFEQSAAGEDGLGVVPLGHGWDEGHESEQEGDEEGWLREDDIEDWE